MSCDYASDADQLEKYAKQEERRRSQQPAAIPYWPNDAAACSGTDCSLRDTCYRYAGYLLALRDKRARQRRMDPPECLCTLYIGRMK